MKFRAINLYRKSHWLYKHNVPVIPKILTGVIYLFFNSYIPHTAEIGADSDFAYGGMGCVIHKNATIGERVVIGQNTTVGRSLHPDSFPTIGNDVYVSAGSRIIGKIKVGNNVIIGANSVVNKDVPDNMIVAGVPAKPIRKVEGSIWSLFENIKFD